VGVIWSVGADLSVKNMLKMPALSAEISSVRTAQDCMNAAQNSELVAALDVTITNWCKQIEKVSSDKNNNYKYGTQRAQTSAERQHNRIVAVLPGSGS